MDVLSMSESSLIKEFCNTLEQLSNKIISTSENLVTNITKQKNEYNTLITKYRDLISQIKTQKQNFFSKLSEGEITDTSNFKLKLDSLIEFIEKDLIDFNKIQNENLLEFNKAKETITAGLKTISRNIDLVFKQYQDDLGNFKKISNQQKIKITEIESKLSKSQDKVNSLNSKLNDIENSYQTLTRQYDDLDRDNKELNRKISDLTKNNLELEKKMNLFEGVVEKIKKYYEDTNLEFNKIKIPGLKLPSNLILTGLDNFGENEIKKLFENINSLLEMDYKLVTRFQNSKTFNETVQKTPYNQILEQLFRNISDVEEKEYNSIKNKISEVEININDPQRQRYIHTDIFAPYLNTARTLLLSHHSKMAKAADKLLDLINEKIDDNELKRLLIRRTGIRNINLENCQISNNELPLESNKMEETINNLKNQLNSQLKEKSNELALRFFEIWRDIAIDLKNKDEVDKILSYVILLTTQKILSKADSKSSDLRKIFSKSIVLI
jgi:DNA repair exonuclease SbcCD ATPase subunit